MERLTLLQMTQKILESMVSDNVNSISDTDESISVSNIIRDTYYEILGRDEWDFMRKITTLDAYGDTTKPVFLKSPVAVSYLRDIKYNRRRSTDTKDYFKDMQYLDRGAFLENSYSLDSSTSNVVTMSYNGVALYCRNDLGPQYYTSFDDDVLVFDSYDATVDTTLQSSKSVAIVISVPTWTAEDTFVPTLPPNMFSLLLAEAKVACHQYLKQSATPIDTKRSLRQSSKNKWDERKVQNRGVTVGFGRTR